MKKQKQKRYAKSIGIDIIAVMQTCAEKTMRFNILIITALMLLSLLAASCGCDEPSTDSNDDDNDDNDADDDADDDANDDIDDDADDDTATPDDDTENCVSCDSHDTCRESFEWGWLCYEDCCTDCVPCLSTTFCETVLGWDYECYNDCCVEKDLDDKPVIYLYPENPMNVSVTLATSPATDLIWSWPPYGDGWDVFVEPGGLIDGIYPYLYYEAFAPNVHDFGIYQFDEGFVAARDELFALLENYMLAVGFEGREVGDFLLYWTQELPIYAWYAVYPQFHEIIRHSVDLVIDPAPDNMLRLWLIFEGYDDYPAQLDLAQPAPVGFSRAGFVAVEWGVIQAFE